MDDIQLNLTLGIIVLTGLISYKGFSDRSFFERYKHYPFAEESSKDYIRFLSSGFLHSGWAHFVFNAYVLLMFGNRVEQYFVAKFGSLFGGVMYLLMYLTCIIAANIPSFLKHRNNPAYGAIGASGAISGVVFISILLNPMSRLGIIFIPIFLPAFIFGLIYLIYSSWAARNQDSRIGHDAHFYGALYGMLFVILFDPRLVPRFFSTIASSF